MEDFCVITKLTHSKTSSLEIQHYIFQFISNQLSQTEAKIQEKDKQKFSILKWVYSGYPESHTTRISYQWFHASWPWTRKQRGLQNWKNDTSLGSGKTGDFLLQVLPREALGICFFTLAAKAQSECAKSWTSQILVFLTLELCCTVTCIPVTGLNSITAFL